MVKRSSFLASSGCFLISTDVLATRAQAEPRAPLEIDVLRQIPPSVLDRLSFDAMPDAEGDMQLNQGHWTGVAFQRVAMPLFWVGAAENNQEKIDGAWRAVDAAFAHQNADGSFASGAGSAMQPTDIAFWLEALGHALVVLQESPLASANASRTRETLPKIATSAAWLQQPDHFSVLVRGDHLSVNRMFTDANAFATCGLLLGNRTYVETARQLRTSALASQTSQGVFLENGGFDSSYQAVSLLHASYLQLCMPDSELLSALQSGLNRELEAVNSDGTIDVSQNTRTGRGQEQIFGHAKQVDQRSVILALFYCGILLGRSDAIDAAKRVVQHAFH